MTDPALSPAHYRSRFGFECIELTKHLTFQAGNAAKYVYRHEDKSNPLQDMGKALVYWRWVIESGDPVILPGHESAVMDLYWKHLDTPAISGDPTARILGSICWREIDSAQAGMQNRIDWITANRGAV